MEKKVKKEKKSDQELFADYIKNMPTECAACHKAHKPDEKTIQYIRLLGDKREPVCNVECAINLAQRWKDQYLDMAIEMQHRIKELKAGKVK